MATSIEAKIITALEAKFLTITLPAGVQIAAPGIAFTPDGTNPYVRVTIAKNQPINHNLSGGKEPERMGIFLAVVCWPTGVGLVPPSELAATIRDAFAFGTKIETDGIRIKIVDEPMVQGDMQNGVYTEIPVVVPWHCYP